MRFSSHESIERALRGAAIVYPTVGVLTDRESGGVGCFTGDTRGGPYGRSGHARTRRTHSYCCDVDDDGRRSSYRFRLLEVERTGWRLDSAYGGRVNSLPDRTGGRTGVEAAVSTGQDAAYEPSLAAGYLPLPTSASHPAGCRWSVAPLLGSSPRPRPGGVSSASPDAAGGRHHRGVRGSSAHPRG